MLRSTTSERAGFAGNAGLAAAGRAHERPAAHLARDQPAPGRFGVGAADGANRDPQPIGEVAMGRQLRARGPGAPMATSAASASAIAR